MRNPNVASLRGEDVWTTLLKAPADAPIIPQIVIDLKTQLYNCANRLVSALITRPKGGGGMDPWITVLQTLSTSSVSSCASLALSGTRCWAELPQPKRETRLCGCLPASEGRIPLPQRLSENRRHSGYEPDVQRRAARA